MNFMDLLLADALAAGMARQAAERSSRPPPDNFFIIPPDVQAWRKLYLACKEEHMVICVEITDDNHAPSRRIQPHIVDLAREITQIPFFRAKVGLGRTHDQLREDLGNIRFTPSVVIVFFDDDGARLKKAEGEEEIKLALRIGAFEKIIKDFIDQRMKLKLAEKFAEQLAGAMADEARRKRQAAIEYEAKLKREKEEMERKAVEEERQKRLEAEKKAEEAKASEQRTKLKAYATEELLKMDLSTAKIRDIKDKMDDLGISYAGCTSRDDLVRKLSNSVPALKSKIDQTDGPGIQSPTSSVPSSYSSSTDRRSIFSNSETDSKGKQEDVSRLQRRIKQLEENVEEINVMRESLETERTRLQGQLREKDEVIRKKDQELTELKNNRPIRFNPRPIITPRGSGGSGGNNDSGKIKELEDELLETRMLYTCTLDDIDVLGVLAKGEGAIVVRAKCVKPDVPNHERVYALKILQKIHEQTTLTKARNNNKNEYEVLSSFAPHKNIVRLFAFFYDRPMTHNHPALKECGEGIALCILMEQLSQNMDSHLKTLRRTTGPNVRHVINWFKDLLAGLQYLYSCNIVHRDLKLENLMMSNDVVKIVDFGEAIKLNTTMKLPYDYPIPKGGNEAHLAPEILNQKVGRNRVLDYTKQPVWAAGVLAYELAGHQSPFCGSKDQKGYDVTTLTSLTGTFCQTGRSQNFPPDMPRLVQSMLHFDASKRPTLEEALGRVTRM